MKKLLMVTIELPYPANSGGRIKSWNMLKALTEHYEVSVASPIKYGTELIDQFKSSIPIAHLYSATVVRERSAKNLLRSYAQRIPLNVYRSRSEELRAKVSEIADQFDIILLDHYEAFQYLPNDYRGKVILHTHNATYLMWERYAITGESLAMRWAARIEALRVRHYERRACDRANIVFAAPNDIDNLCNLGCDRKKFRETYHLGDDSQLALKELCFDSTKEQLFYVGTLSWEANVDGLLWFFDEVWPQLKLKRPLLEFLIAGGNPDPRLVEAASKLEGIQFLGYVDDLEPYFTSSRLFIAPLRFGAGIKVKVLNTMCRGLPIVTTSVGAEGLAVKHLQHIAIANNPEETSSNIDRLLDDSSLWELIRDESRNIVKAKYTWKRVLGDMVSEMQALFSNSQPNKVMSDELH